MTTYTATKGAAGIPVPGHGFGGNKKQAWGVYSVTASLAAGDIIRLCRLPKGAVVTGGRFFGSKIEISTSGAAFDVDVGYEANGTDSADPDAFGNNGVLVHAAVSGVKPELGYNYPFGGVLNTAGPKTLAAETIVGLTITASALNFTTGVLGVVVDFEVP